jgi:hypothetical protein
MQPGDSAREFVVRYGNGVEGFRGVICVALVVNCVVPAGHADAKSHVAIGGIDLREQIQTVGNDARREIAVTVVIVGIAHQRGVIMRNPESRAIP